MTDQLKGCPICDEAPQFSSVGSCIDIDCCVSMSAQKCDVLQEILDEEGNGLRWSSIPAEGEYGCDFVGYTDKILANVIGWWNTRPNP